MGESSISPSHQQQQVPERTAIGSEAIRADLVYTPTIWSEEMKRE
jgi:hypothetical protein